MHWTTIIGEKVQEGISIVPHTADLQLRIQAKTLPELFQLAVIGMFQSMQPEAPGCIYKNDTLICPDLPCSQKITLQAQDKEQLLVDFLSNALYLSDVHNQVYLEAEISISTQNKLSAALHGVSITGLLHEIKAVTYHNMAIVHKDGLWQTDIVFDI